MAERSGLQTGSEAEIVLLRNGEEIRRSRAIVVDIFKTGLFDQDSTLVRLSTADFAKLYGDEQFTPRSLNISVKDIYRSDEMARLVRERVGSGFRVVDWQEANRPLFAALSLEKKVAFAIILLIILIAALNITTTLALLVNERRSDIAVLRTCGAKGKSLVLTFVLEGLLLGTMGVIGRHGPRFSCLLGGKCEPADKFAGGCLLAGLRSAAADDARRIYYCGGYIFALSDLNDLPCLCSEPDKADGEFQDPVNT